MRDFQERLRNALKTSVLPADAFTGSEYINVYLGEPVDFGPLEAVVDEKPVLVQGRFRPADWEHRHPFCDLLVTDVDGKPLAGVSVALRIGDDLYRVNTPTTWDGKARVGIIEEYTLLDLLEKELRVEQQLSDVEERARDLARRTLKLKHLVPPPEPKMTNLLGAALDFNKVSKYRPLTPEERTLMVEVLEEALRMAKSE